MGRRIASVTDGALFERLLTKYSTPDELFGPLSLAQLENDKYVRKIDKYLPTAKVAFLDEIFKANSAILNSLLTILNERKFDNGIDRINIPLLTVVGASNELPDSEELEALYDRFLFRKTVSSVSDKSIFELLSLRSRDDDVIESNKVFLDENVLDIILQAENDVEIPQYILNLLRNVRMYLRDEADPSTPVSDRRLIKIARMLRISAATNNRNIVAIQDCLLLKHVLWYAPEDQESITSWLWENLVPTCDEKGFEFLLKSLKDRIHNVCDTSNTGNFNDNEGNDKSAIMTEISTLLGIFESKLEEYGVLQKDLSIKGNNIWIGSADDIGIRQRLSLVVEKRLNFVKNILDATRKFEELLSGDNNNNNNNNNGNNDECYDDMQSALSERVDITWTEYVENNRKLKGSGVINNSGDALGDYYAADLEEQMVETAFGLTSGEMTSKEAKSKLTPQAYKAWKKANKARSKKKVGKNIDSHHDDDGYYD